jgi:DNA-binding SARP family transcriptional activator
MLGPLELSDKGEPVSLGGTRQRATLGFLLLNANRVVATSQLLNALWAVEEAPTSARKILQNAIWGLRGALSCGNRVAGAAVLQTRTPGYLLSVDPDEVDLFRFHRLAQEGRAELTSGSPATATRLLNEALALWSGPPLADLAETGIAWSELTALENARLDVLEDHFEAELACGHHHSVLSSLEALVESEPLRERLCGQLMLALYRCGRQADALAVYGRVRSGLVENLGLEPGASLQNLQRAILVQDASLLPPELVRPAPIRMAVQKTTEVANRRAEQSGGQFVAERANVSALMVRTRFEGDHDDVDRSLESAAAMIRTAVECLGGTIAASIGSVSLALFGLPDERDDDADRAVRAALAVQDVLGAWDAERGLAVHAVVGTGEALVRYRSDAPGSVPAVNGALLDQCHSRLLDVPAGEIRVCDRTWRRTTGTITYEQPGDPGAGWRAVDSRTGIAGQDAVPDHEPELEVLRGLLERTRNRERAHLVTVLGESGIGKTRFTTEFRRRVEAEADHAFLVVRAPARGGTALAVHAQMLTAQCGIRPGEPTETARSKLTARVRGLVGEQRMAELLPPLLMLLESPEEADAGEVLAAWRELLREIALERPLVIVVDDLHHADEQVLDFIESLAESIKAAPLLVIAVAQPELLDRRPGWAGGKRQATAITFDPLSDKDIDSLLELLMSTVDGPLPVDWKEPVERRNYLRVLLRLATSARKADDVRLELARHGWPTEQRARTA